VDGLRGLTGRGCARRLKVVIEDVKNMQLRGTVFSSIFERKRRHDEKCTVDLIYLP
jgi:hypothetical protein